MALPNPRFRSVAMKQKGMKKKHNIYSRFKEIDITLLLFILIIVPFVLLIIWMVIARQIFDGNIPERIQALTLAVLGFLLGLGGVAQVIRREAPGFLGISAKGLLPVLSGIIWIVVCWGLGIVMFFFTMLYK